MTNATSVSEHMLHQSAKSIWLQITIITKYLVLCRVTFSCRSSLTRNANRLFQFATKILYRNHYC